MAGAAPGLYLYSLAPLISPPDGLDFRAALVFPGHSQTLSPAASRLYYFAIFSLFFFFFSLPFTSETFLSQLPRILTPVFGN